MKVRQPASAKSFLFGLAFAALLVWACSAFGQAADSKSAVHLIRNADGSVTIPASELEKLAGVVQQLDSQNQELWATVSSLAKQLEIKASQRCI